MVTCDLLSACVHVNENERDALETTFACLDAPTSCIFSHSETLRSSSGVSLGICRNSSTQDTSDVTERLTTMEEFPAAPLLVGTASFSGSEDFSASSSDLSAESVADANDFTSEETADTDDSHGSRVEPCHPQRERAMLRCSSDGSMVTSQPVPESDYTTCDMPSECTRGNNKDFSTNTILQMVDSSGMSWTDDKHSSYLNSIEATFVRKMYDREFCALDLCGQAPRHTDTSELECVESRRRDDNEQVSGTLEFKTWQLRDLHRVAFTRPVLFPNPMLSSQLFSSPWVKHSSVASNGRVHVDGAIHMQMGFPGFDADTESKGFRHNEPLQEIVDESPVPVVEQKIFNLQDSLPMHLHRCHSSFAESKQGIPTTVMDPLHCTKGVLRLSKHKRHLTKMDLQATNQDSGCSKQASHSSRRRGQVKAEERPLKISKVSRVTPDYCHHEADENDGRSVMSDHSVPMFCSTNFTGTCVFKISDPGFQLEKRLVEL